MSETECIYISECGNVDKACFKCVNYNKYKPIKARNGLRAKSENRKEKKEGMDFEKRGVKNYSRAVNHAKDVARQQIASGALAHALGDMITEEELTASLSEFKERGSKDAKGAKTISIKLEWLEKLEEEAREMGRDFYFLPFSYKGHDKDYVALDYNILLRYIQTIQILLESNRLLRSEIEREQEDNG